MDDVRTELRRASGAFGEPGFSLRDIQELQGRRDRARRMRAAGVAAVVVAVTGAFVATALVSRTSTRVGNRRRAERPHLLPGRGLRGKHGGRPPRDVATRRFGRRHPHRWGPRAHHGRLVTGRLADRVLPRSRRDTGRRRRHLDDGCRRHRPDAADRREQARSRAAMVPGRIQDPLPPSSGGDLRRSVSAERRAGDLRDGCGRIGRADAVSRSRDRRAAGEVVADRRASSSSATVGTHPASASTR